MCVYYRGFNWLTIKNWYLSPLISRLLDWLNHAKVYIKIDLHEAYNLMCIQESNEWNMMFKTYYDNFEYVVMPFGFINTLILFQHLMNNVFHEYLDNCVVPYIDDIFIFSKNMEDHERHVLLVLEKFWGLGKVWCFGCRPFWIQQNHGVNVLTLLVAITLEVCEGICQILWRLCLSKKSTSLFSWSPSTIINPYIPVVFNFHGFYHKAYTF